MPGLVPGGKGLYAYNRVTIANNIFQHLVYPKTVPAGNTGTLAIELTARDRHERAGRCDRDCAGIGRPDPRGGRTVGDRPGFRHRSITLTSNLLAASVVGTSRTAATYAAERGLGSGDAGFINAVRSQSAQAWNTTASASALVTYIRSGFGLG